MTQRVNQPAERPGNQTAAELKERVRREIGQFRPEAEKLGAEFFAIPETGFHEERTEQKICACLDEWQIPYTNHIARHGVNCTLKGVRPGYHVAVLADIDALLVQKGDRSLPLHSCGHSIQTTVLLNLIRGLTRSRIMEEIPGKVSFIFTPAEEFIELEERKRLRAQGIISHFSGKQQMIAEGLFDDIDAVLSCHVMNPDPARPELLFDLGSSLAGFVHKRIEFTGRDAHSGAVPHLGRNALHGASLSLTAVQMLKDTFPPEAHVRLYPILSEGGGVTVNTICSRAVLETYLRTQDETSLRDISARLDQLFTSCARALELGCTVTTSPGYLPLSQEPRLAAVVADNMTRYCDESRILRNVISGASGDIGDISTILPTIQFGFTGIEGHVHSADFVIRDTVHVYETTAMLLADTITDLLLREELQVRYPDKLERKERYINTWLAEQVSLKQVRV
ncbi:MAG: amidohydrolase [Spirochaetaceae bacterium]|jgi:amidohydrolase|nr:amidohydrolase [Spirochaetaceae bacterium]